MQYSGKKLLAAAALMAATLCASSSTDARKTGDPARQDERVLFRLSDNQRPDGFEATVKNGAVVGMTVVKKDGSRVALKQQSKPTCPTGCPAGQKLTGWEDESQTMSITVCGTGHGVSGTPGRATVVITVAA